MECIYYASFNENNFIMATYQEFYERLKNNRAKALEQLQKTINDITTANGYNVELENFPDYIMAYNDHIFWCRNVRQYKKFLQTIPDHTIQMARNWVFDPFDY